MLRFCFWEFQQPIFFFWTYSILDLQQFLYCNWEALNFAPFICEYFRHEPVSSTDKILKIIGTTWLIGSTFTFTHMSQKAPSPPSLLRRPQAPPAESPPWSAAFKNSSMSSLDYPLTTMARAAVFASNGLSLTHNSPGRGTSLLLMIPLIKGGFSADLFSSSACLLSKCSSPLVKAFLPVSPKYSATPLFELKWGFWIWILNFFEFFFWIEFLFQPAGHQKLKKNNSF